MLPLPSMTLRELQRRAVDGIKRHALVMSLASPRAQARILTEYLWSEEGVELGALHDTRTPSTPAWVDKLVTRQMADERRHASLLRARLDDMGATYRPPPSLMKVKLAWLERTVRPYLHAFAEGPIVVLMAVAAQLEATGVRMFGRHVDVLETHAASDPTTAALRSILADEKRHARSCAAARDRLVRPEERALLEELHDKIARIDRAFGVTLAVTFWLTVAGNVVREAA